MKTTRARIVGVLVIALLVVLIGSRFGTSVVPGTAARALTSQTTISCSDWRSGSGMMGSGASGGMMGGNSTNGGMSAMGTMWGLMGSMGMMGTYGANDQPISAAQARQALDQYAASCGAGVKVDDVMAFASNYYGSLVDASGHGYLEVLVDRFTGAVYPEPQSMMWNTTSGMHTNQGNAKYDQNAARQLATTFLASYLPGVAVTDANSFPGYYTFDFGTDTAHPVGMLSVNAATGEVWVHTWHGPALAGG
jgi:hypothetical protein